MRDGEHRGLGKVSGEQPRPLTPEDVSGVVPQLSEPGRREGGVVSLSCHNMFLFQLPPLNFLSSPAFRYTFRMMKSSLPRSTASTCGPAASCTEKEKSCLGSVLPQTIKEGGK